MQMTQCDLHATLCLPVAVKDNRLAFVSISAGSGARGWKRRLLSSVTRCRPSPHRCLATTNVIESPQAGVRKKTDNICRWRDADMALRRVAGTSQLTEKNCRKTMGHGICGPWPEFWAARKSRCRPKAKGG